MHFKLSILLLLLFSCDTKQDETEKILSDSEYLERAWDYVDGYNYGKTDTIFIDTIVVAKNEAIINKNDTWKKKSVVSVSYRTSQYALVGNLTVCFSKRNAEILGIKPRY